MAGKNPFYGATFAERKAIREGKTGGSTKAVDSETEQVEDKAVAPKKASTKHTARQK